MNLPLDELRTRHEELPDGPVVVHCQVGQRGHIAARVLAQLGHDVRNLDGGYKTWAAGTAGADAAAAARPTTFLTTTRHTGETMQQITVDHLATTPGAHVIDVREPDEYRTGHVPGATNIPLSQLAERFGEVPTGSPVHVICQAGGRSARATEALTAAGIDAVDVAGGTSAWQAAGHTVDAA